MALSSGASGATGFTALGTIKKKKKTKHTIGNQTWHIAGTAKARIIIIIQIFYSLHSALRRLLCRVVLFACDESTKRGRTSRGTSVKHTSISVLS